ncbi:MAG: hypothetical protein K5643_04995 [Saccharofermentans sp.]|nr:hypothetical protein [Saccharofermentans sp.]
MRNLKFKIRKILVPITIISFVLSFSFEVILADNKTESQSGNDEFEMLSYDVDSGEKYISYFKNVVKDTDAELISPAHFDGLDSSPTQQYSYPDSLSPVSNANVSPYKNVVMCRNGFDLNNDGSVETWNISSGGFVYNDLIFTCAHGIYWYAYSKTANVVRVYKALNSSTLPSTYISLSGWHLPTQYTSSKDVNYDWAVLVTTSTTGSWFGYGYANSITNKAVNSAGYVDQNAYYYFMQESPGIMSSYSSYRFTSTIYTLGGQSGSAVFDSNSIVWGVLTGTLNANGRGCLVTSHVYSVLEGLK